MEQRGETSGEGAAGWYLAEAGEENLNKTCGERGFALSRPALPHRAGKKCKFRGGNS